MDRIILILTLTSMAVMIVFAIWMAMRQQKRLRRAQAEGKFSPLLPEEAMFELEGKQFRTAYQPGGNKMPACFILQTDCSAGGAFHVTREGGVERFFKRMNVDSEVQTGDRDFDDGYYLITDDKDFTWQVLSDSRKRQAVEALFNLGFNVVTVDTDLVEAVIEPYDPQHALGDNDRAAAAKWLQALAHHLPVGGMSTAPAGFYLSPRYRTHSLDGPRTPRRVFAVVFPLLLEPAGIFMVLLGVFNYQPLDPWSLVFKSLLPSGVMLLIYLRLAMTWLRGRATSHRDMIMAFILALTAFPVAGAGAALFVNGYLDQSPALRHVQRVTDKYFTRSKDSINYYLVVDSWRGGGTEEIRVNEVSYREAQVGRSRITLVSHAGYFGYEWVKGYQLQR